MGYEGRISSKFIFMYNGVLVITQGCIRTNLGCELRALDAMNNSRLWMALTKLGRPLKVLNAMKSRGLWMI